ncbi:MAG: hypothetical protein ACRD3R_02355 [Terriglobales bacterium]
MKKTKKVLGASLLAALLTPLAQAQSSDVSVTMGLKAWNTEWTTWFIENLNLAVGDSSVSTSAVTNQSASRENVLIPSIAVRYGNWFASGSFFIKKSFSFGLERREYDVNLGYAVLPGLAMSVGYKDLRYEGTTNSYQYEAKGLTVGVNGSAPINSNVSIYGALAYGRPDVRDNAGRNGVSKRSGDYLLSEVGLAFPLGRMSESLRSTVMTAGYRYQRLDSKKHTSTFTLEGASTPVAGLGISYDLIDTTQGIAIGISSTF